MSRNTLSVPKGRMAGGVAVRRDIVGHPGHVANVLRAAENRGRLVRYSPPVRTADGRIYVRALMLEPRKRMAITRRQLWWTAGISTGTAALGVMAWIVVTWVAAHIVPILICLAALLLLAGGAGKACPGLHCRGCRG